MKVTALLVPVLAAALLVGCNRDSRNNNPHNNNTHGTKANMGMVNKNCPVSGRAASSEHTTQYKGQTVGFCCGGCPERFNKMSDAEKTAKVNEAR